MKIKRYLDAVIGGIVLNGNGLEEFGGLLLGLQEGDRLRYIGWTDFGFGGKLKYVLNRVVTLIRPASPFDVQPKLNGSVVWVEPRIPCRVRFSDWTKGGEMLHPMFVSLREDS